MKLIILAALILSAIFFFTRFHVVSQPATKHSRVEDQEPAKAEEPDTLISYRRYSEKARQLRSYIAKHPAYDAHTVFLVDMRIPSGNKRFFVYDLDSSRVLTSGLVAHGSGCETGIADSLVFGNVPESYRSSLGRYKIGYSYAGMFGKAYKLYGLDPTNSKAFDRLIVLHRYQCVPDEEQDFPICNSLGCPMVSENFFPVLEEYIEKAKKPLLLEIYY